MIASQNFLLEVVTNPQGFFTRLKQKPVQWAVPILMLFAIWVVSNLVPVLVGELTQPNLLASLIFTATAGLGLIVCAVLLAGGARVLEVLGFAVAPLLLAMLLMSGLWFLGDIGKGIGSVIILIALILAVRSVFIGLSIMTQNPSATWRTILLAPVFTFFFMAIPFGLLLRWAGLA